MAECSSCGGVVAASAKFCPECGAALAADHDLEIRKVVTVLFCDVVGSTALGEAVDAEVLRAKMARYFERMKAVVERHGGTVEKFIGDAVMAVFGVPTLHEDDAVRALRSAIDMQRALPELGLQGRIGVNTGEVVTGTRERLATGDVVNVAARLQQAAEPDEVLVGRLTVELAAAAATVEPVPPLVLKGKADPVEAFRLLTVDADVERPLRGPFVGRHRELDALRQVWDRVVDGSTCELVTVVGDPGVGKSRLLNEFVATIDATVTRARCLPYGEGITYWPVLEVLRELGVRPDDAAAATAIESLLGETDTISSSDDIAWAFRKTLEQAATERPLLVVFDDIQWGEPTFFDLIEHVALLSIGCPMLVVCLARPELLENRPGWPVTHRLGPLTDADVVALIGPQLPARVRERIAEAAAGNPLFVHEMLAMADGADEQVTVPSTLQLLLAARLDQLDPGDRQVLEHGSVEGEVFHRGALQALGATAGLGPQLTALVRKELIRPDRTQLGGDAFRFRHLLLRNTAYEALPKSVRALLHQRLAGWLADEHGDALEVEQVLGYHLEQAIAYLRELGQPVDPVLAERARQHLAMAGHRAFLRQDYHAARVLLQRALAAAPDAGIDLAAEMELIDALFIVGFGAEAMRSAAALADRAAANGQPVAEMCARIKDALLRVFLEPEGATEALESVIAEAMPRFEAAGNDLALYTAYRALAQVSNMRALADRRADAADRAAAHARRVGLADQLLGWRAGGRVMGTTPVPDALAWFEAQEGPGVDEHAFRMYWAVALAMAGRFDEARAIVAAQQAVLSDRGAQVWLAAGMGQFAVVIELLAGDAVAAVAYGRTGCQMLEDLGERSFLSTAAARLGRALYAAADLDGALAWSARAAEIGASDDMLTQQLWRQVRALVLAHRNGHDEACRLAQEAVDIAAVTDSLDDGAAAYADLAEVLDLCGRPAEARTAREQACDRYRRKGNVVMLERLSRSTSQVPSAGVG